jgi:NitT/TauT family transport system permease protein/sulfonate transport system permease protein
MAAGEIATRLRPASPLVQRVLGEGMVVAALVAWWIASAGLPEFVLPGPVAVGRRLVELFTTWTALEHTLTSAWRVLASVAIALVLGGGLALLARFVPVLEDVVHQCIKPFINSFPSIGWAILAAIWFEPGDVAVVFVQVAILTPFCLINISEGLRALDRELLEMGVSFSRRRGRLLGRIVLPLLMPYVIAALRIAYGIGWKISLVAELLGSTSGLGYLMLRAQTSADTATVIATCFAIVLIFVAGERLVLAPLSRRFRYT